MKVRLGPLAVALGVGGGVAVAAALCPHVPGWGGTFAFPAATLVLSIGAWKEDDGEEMLALLGFALGLTGGYLAVAVPLTWLSLDEATIARLGGEIWARWTVISLALPEAVTTLLLRRRRERALSHPSGSRATSRAPCQGVDRD